MKKYIFFLFFLTAIAANAQQYEIVTDIPYYAALQAGKDSYLESTCTLDLYYPKDKKGFPTIIWFHGGGLTGGEKEIPKELMEQGFAVIGVGYRLSPKVTAPTYIEDATAATSWVFQNIQKYGGNPDVIFLSGHSAGAYLALMVSMDKKYLQKYAIDANKIAAVASLSAQVITHFTIREERGIKITQPIIDDYAPIYHVRADLPPILLFTGDAEKELMGRYEENAFMYRTLLLNNAQGARLYKMDGYDHGNMRLGSFPLMLKELSRITRRLKQD